MQPQTVFTGILRPDIKLLNRHDQILLFDPGADTYFKITAQTRDIIALMTEKMPLADFLQRLADNGIVISQEELIGIVVFLRQNNLLIPEYGEVVAKQKTWHEHRKKTRLLRFSHAYLFFRLPPWRPEKFFARIEKPAALLASRGVITVLILLALPGYLLALRDAGLVCRTFADTLSWGGLVKYFLALILLKVLHEAAHSIAAIHFHCRVRGIGLGFMLFYPRLYTDTTDSWQLPRRQRLLIDAAGIIAELLIGGIAALLWSNLPPGSTQSTMFYIFTVSTLSTLLVNGNPFIRYDGYYILCDLLNVENLMQRSFHYVKQWWRYSLLKLGTPPAESRGKLLFLFGICSYTYRIFLYTSIIMLIYHNFARALAIVMLILEFYALLLHPCWVELQTLRKMAAKQGKKAAVFLLIFLLTGASLLLCLPLSWGMHLPGEVVPAARTPVTVTETGFLQKEFPRMPVSVCKGDILIRLENPQLDYALQKLKKTLEYDRTLHQLQLLDEKEYSNAQVTARKIQSDLVALAELRRKQQNLTIRAAEDGLFVPALPSLSAGVSLPGNTHAGEILSPDRLIYAYANDREIHKIRPGMTAEIYAGDTLRSCRGRVIAVDTVPGQLQATPLLQPFGGPIPVYPDKTSFTPVQTLYRITLKPAGDMPYSAGRSVRVKLDHKERAGKYILRFILVLFRKEF